MVFLFVLCSMLPRMYLKVSGFGCVVGVYGRGTSSEMFHNADTLFSCQAA